MKQNEKHTFLNRITNQLPTNQQTAAPDLFEYKKNFIPNRSPHNCTHYRIHEMHTHIQMVIPGRGLSIHSCVCMYIYLIAGRRNWHNRFKFLAEVCMPIFIHRQNPRYQPFTYQMKKTVSLNMLRSAFLHCPADHDYWPSEEWHWTC